MLLLWTFLLFGGIFQAKLTVTAPNKLAIDENLWNSGSASDASKLILDFLSLICTPFRRFG